MKRMMRSGNGIRRGISLLLMMSLLIALLPTAAVAATTPGPYGIVKVTTKNVVIRMTPGGTRTGFFAQIGEYPMIGPSIELDGVIWYNLQTKDTAGFVSGKYATADYGSAGMPTTEKTYVDILAATNIFPGDTPVTGAVAVPIAAGTILQLVNGNPYTAIVNGVSGTYINLYFNSTVYYTAYTGDFAKGVMTQDNLNNYISEVTWKSSVANPDRAPGVEGDYLTHALQAALYILDYYTDAVDGNYGPITSEAVMDFRADNNILPLTSNVANATVFQKAFAQAVERLAYLRTNPGLGDTTPTTPTVNMIQTTVNGLRIRKSYSTSSAYVGKIEEAGTILTYTRTHISGSVTWYYIQYQGLYGWVMGTYVKPYTSTTTPTTPTTPVVNYGTVTVTKKLVAIRTSPNGSRSGYHVDKGDVCTLIGPNTDAGGYTWYHIRTENGRTGYIRGDCAQANTAGAGMPASDKNYVQILYDNMQIRKGSNPGSPTGNWMPVPKNTVLQLATGSSYTDGGIKYINVYYNNEVYHTRYDNNLIDGLMTENNANGYISTVIWAQGFGNGQVAGYSSTAGVTYHTGDIHVHAIQAALYLLGYYNDKMDGMFGSKTAAAVRKFKDATKDIVTNTDETVNTAVSQTLFAAASAALQALLTTVPDTSDDTVPYAGNFGPVTLVKRGSWAEIDGGSRSLFPKGSVATVMSVATKKVFRLYRWSGANHADCVPYDSTDTAALCSILGFSYNANHPNATQLSKIKAYGNDDYPLFTWPDFRGGFGGAAISGSKEKIAVWVNLNGTVYCASLYVIPHGYDGISGFSNSKINGQYFYERNNMYGMLCLHFYGSTTHSTGTMNATHMANVAYAYNMAASQFGSSLVK